MGRVLLSLAVLSLCGCHPAARASLPSQALAGQVDADTYAGAQDLKSSIETALPSYQKDGLARYERTEIATVEADLALIDQMKTGVDWVNAVGKLSDDWDALVALDGVLQEEHFS